MSGARDAQRRRSARPESAKGTGWWKCALCPAEDSGLPDRAAADKAGGKHYRDVHYEPPEGAT